MMIRPQDDPAQVEATLQRDRFVGFKVYHVFASRSDTFNAEQGEFLPEWAWDLAQQHGLVIMMHMVLPLALSRGAGAASRHAIGTGVFGGMLSATVLGIFFVPIFFVFVQRYFVRGARRSAG